MYRQVKSTSKYRNVSKEYGGRIYHSKMEAAYAQELDLRVKGGDITEWEPQFKVSLDVNGHHICNYYVDFRVTYPDESVELVEVKGFETEIWRLKRKLLEAIYLKENSDHRYLVVK